MGDLVELTTWPGHPNVFYKITGNSLRFQVKAAGYAGIGMAKKTGPRCDIMLALSHNNYTFIKQIDSNDCKKTETLNLLSVDEYRTFWLTWYGDAIRIGRENEIKPIITYNTKVADSLEYVTFSVTNNQYPVHWKFYMPPKIEKPLWKAVTGGDLKWVQVNSESQFPDNALIGGFENESLYIIRAQHRGSLTPGKFVSSEGLGYISWGGHAHEKDSFELLCGLNCEWVPTCRDKIPVGAIVAGYSENQERENLYIGRVEHNGHVIPGKVQVSQCTCSITYQGDEITKETYEILVIHKENSDVNPATPLIEINDWRYEEHSPFHEFAGNDQDDDDDDEDDDYDDDNIINVIRRRGLYYDNPQDSDDDSDS